MSERLGLAIEVAYLVGILLNVLLAGAGLVFGWDAFMVAVNAASALALSLTCP